MKRARGLSLVEMLITLAVGMSGLLAMAGFQASLQRTSALGKQRAEATLRAQQWIEAARAFEVLKTEAGKAAFQDIAALATPVPLAGLTATYNLTAGVDNYRFDRVSGTFVLDNASTEVPAYKRLGVRLNWKDPTGQDATLGLTTLVAGLDPRTGASAFRPPAAASFNRNPGVPPTATSQSNGTSTFRPGGAAGTVNPTLTYSNYSGRVVSVGTTPLAAGSYSVMGYVTGWSGAGTRPNTPIAGVDVTMSLAGYPAAPDASVYRCWDDSTGPAISGTITYVCVMPPPQDASSSVTLRLAGVTFASGTSGDTVCKYAANANPYSGEALRRGHTNQNYFVLYGSSACPADAPRWQP